MGHYLRKEKFEKQVFFQVMFFNHATFLNRGKFGNHLTVGFDSVIQLTESQPESAVKFSF